MRKQLKSIAAAIMAVAMLISISVPAMAAEQVARSSCGEVYENVEMPTGVVDNNVYAASSVRLESGKTLAEYLYVTEPTRTVQYRVKGKSIFTEGKSVTFNFLPRNSTSFSRSFTVTADNSWHSTTYTSSWPAGYYKLWVNSVQTEGNYEVDVIFLP